MRRFGAEAGEHVSVLLSGCTERGRLAAVGEAIVECDTGAELIAAADRIVAEVNSAG